ncbi:MAG: hypothetical protein EBZ74_06055 [Planctomycetia bacterium]|nr:hypothetical protein [Planctomycetia bacterium]
MVLLMVNAVYGFNLAALPLWGDEGDTGWFSRTTLATGVPSAVFEENVSASSNCYQLSRDLLSRQLPWLQYYIGAASIGMFGADTSGLRRLFAIAGALSAVPMYLMVRPRNTLPALAVLPALLHPQAVLFARQARYYPLVTLLAALWVYLALAGPAVRSLRLVLHACVACLIFHSHPVAAFGLWTALLIHAWFWSKAYLWERCLGGGIGIMSWLVWYASMSPASTASFSSWGIVRHSPLAWVTLAGTGVVAGISDLDYVGALPLLAWVVIGAWHATARVNRQNFRSQERSLEAILLIAVATSSLTSAVVIGVEGTPGWAVLRYAPHAIPFALLALWLTIDALPIPKAAAVVLWLAVVGCNVGSLNHWLTILPRPGQPFSWWPDVYGEIATSDKSLDSVERAIRALPPDTTVVVAPRWWNEVWLFRVGDHVRLVPDIKPASPCGMIIHRALGATVYGEIMTPQFVLAYASDLPSLRVVPAAEFHARWLTCDGTRPELTRHEFVGVSAASGTVVLAPVGRAVQ